jgi:hypothetical protein
LTPHSLPNPAQKNYGTVSRIGKSFFRPDRKRDLAHHGHSVVFGPMVQRLLFGVPWFLYQVALI